MRRLATTLTALFSVALPAAAVVLLAPLACSPKPSGEDLRITGPNVQEFTAPCQAIDGGPNGAQLCGVSAMLERRCGSLDCHGFVGRPLRIYSKYGLRLPPIEGDGGLEPGLGETTPEERSANYRAAVGIEPERTQDVALTLVEPNTLLLYRKPVSGEFGERHKGGSVINKGDDSETCLLTWLKGATDRVACGKAAELP